MKAILLLAFLAVPQQAEARARGSSTVTPIARNDGNARIPFAISCSSDAWTVVGSTKTTATIHNATDYVSLRRRSLTVQTLSTVTYSVCLATTTATSADCVDGMPGYEIGAPWGSVTMFDEGLWYCRTRSGGPTRIKGNEFYDNRDEVK